MWLRRKIGDGIWRLCSIMGEIWLKPGAKVLEYLEIIEITSCLMIGELYMRFEGGFCGEKSIEFFSVRSLRVMKVES